MSDEMVTITKAEYDRLLETEEIMSYLNAAGIDNTEAYSEGMCAYYEDNPEDDA